MRDAAVNGRTAQIATIPRRHGERVKSTLRCVRFGVDNERLFVAMMSSHLATIVHGCWGNQRLLVSRLDFVRAHVAKVVRSQALDDRDQRRGRWLIQSK